ncbi:MAG: hypothetical protein H2067_12360 [Alcanivorax sp.]|nr:hypothetical protein [Alcanivorax sp.]
MPKPSERKNSISILWLLFPCLIIVAIWFFYPKIIEYLSTTILDFKDEPTISTINSYGSIGDLFGGLSALFSGLAFAGLIYTILLQRKDLESTRKEVSRQSSAYQKQRFEDTFFQLLNLRNNVLKELDLLAETGRSALKIFFERIIVNDKEFSTFLALKKLNRDEIRHIDNKKNIPDSATEKLSNSEKSTIEEALESVPTAFSSFLDDKTDSQIAKLKYACNKAISESVDELSHFIRNSLQVLSYIESSTIISEKDKSLYLNIFRSQISDIELATIFYCTMVSDSFIEWAKEPLNREDTIKLLKKTEIFNNLSDRFIIHETHKSLI